jgi:hypothetical protein
LFGIGESLAPTVGDLAAVRPGASAGDPTPRRHGDLAVRFGRAPPDQPAPEQFRVLARNGAEPGPYDQGWKDTVDVRASESAEVAVRFTDHSGPVRLPLPQPGTRGYGDDGRLRDQLS